MRINWLCEGQFYSKERNADWAGAVWGLTFNYLALFLYNPVDNYEGVLLRKKIYCCKEVQVFRLPSLLDFFCSFSWPFLHPDYPTHSSFVYGLFDEIILSKHDKNLSSELQTVFIGALLKRALWSTRIGTAQQILYIAAVKGSLTHFSSMFHFHTPWKLRETPWSSEVFREYRNGV